VVRLCHPPLVRFQRWISSRGAPEIDDFAAHHRGTVGVEGESLSSPHDVERQLADNGGSCLSHSGETFGGGGGIAKITAALQHHLEGGDDFCLDRMAEAR